MIHLRYTLTPRARVSAGRGGEVQQDRSIHTVLPGTTVRGALGTAWWQGVDDAFAPTAGQATRQARFDHLFGRAMVVSDAVPVATDANPVRELPRFMTRSMVRRKYDPEGMVHDLAGSPLATCPDCGNQLVATSGKPPAACSCGTVFEPVRPGWWTPPEWQVSATRTALDHGVAATGNLFTRRAVTTHVVYTGTITLLDDAIDSSVLAWLRADKSLSIGGQLSLHGRARWGAEYAAPPVLPDGDTVVLQLRSPAILVDRRGFPALDLVAALRAIPGAGDVGHSWVRTDQVSTWHGIARVPKPVEWAVAAGSAVILHRWGKDALATARSGLGVRRLEGFGQVALRSPEELATFDRWPSEPLLVEAPGGGQEPTPAVGDGPDEPDDPEVGGVVTPMVAELVELLPPDRRGRALNAVVGAARRVLALRESGIDPQAALRQEFSKPWVMALRPQERALVRSILTDEGLGAMVVQLEAERRRA